jgi:hypothetical protein
MSRIGWSQELAALTHVSNNQEIRGTYGVSEKLFSHKVYTRPNQDGKIHPES